MITMITIIIVIMTMTIIIITTAPMDHGQEFMIGKGPARLVDWKKAISPREDTKGAADDLHAGKRRGLGGALSDSIGCFRQS